MKKANPTLIGAFVIGAILIAVAAIVFFGSTKLFTPQRTYITFVDQSVAGLQVGSQVKFKGVPIGQVTKIFIRFRDDTGEPPLIGILFNVDSSLVRDQDGPAADIFDQQLTQDASKTNLRATLATESLITGQLYIEMDVNKDAPPPRFYAKTKTYTEIPSAPSSIQAILENATKAIGNLGQVDFKGLAQQLQDLLKTLQTSLAQINFDTLDKSLERALNSFSDVASSPELKGTLENAKGMLAELTTTLKKLQTEIIDPAGPELKPTLAEARKTLQALQKTTGQLNNTLSSDGQLNDTLSQLDRTLQSIQQLSEFLERHPSSLIFGRKPAQPKK